ncbi:hypothetical protein CASFOL_027852 [Castilleja foliolosa]|uniref:F-box domain-containing protein n=1 Tax=Castilleja foliolosa TaxID=1961234 RepID=A0ABD3CG15_9LAMI
MPSNNQATNSAAALAACEDLMLLVLARLPVKTICRFKSVCKPWNHLLSTQEFIKLQYKLSTESKNQSFIIHRFDKNHSNIISVFDIESKEKILDHPFNYTLDEIDVVGCCNGLVCIKRGQEFVLWNPAMNLSKTVPLMKDHTCIPRISEGFWYDAEGDESQGFGYDAEGDDFKVVRIVWLIGVRRAEVYSVNSDSWTIIDLRFQFSDFWIYRSYSDAIVNGDPYWFAHVNVIKKEVLICFDMSKLVFKTVPLSSLDYNEVEQFIRFVDLNGSLGALVFNWKNGERIEYIEYVDCWVFDDGEQIWTKSHRVGPINVKINWFLRSLKDGRVLGKLPNGQLIVFNSETEFVEDLFNVGHDFEIYEYTASLAYIQGMEKVTLR